MQTGTAKAWLIHAEWDVTDTGKATPNEHIGVFLDADKMLIQCVMDDHLANLRHLNKRAPSRYVRRQAQLLVEPDDFIYEHIPKSTTTWSVEWSDGPTEGENDGE